MVYFDGEDVNLQMARAGMAWHYKDYENEQSPKQRRQYSRAESKARKNRHGLWNGNSIEPWVFRKMN